MNRLEFFRQIQAKCEKLATPQMDAVWRPIMEQLAYLIAFEIGESVDRAMIQNIDLGLRALRNLDDVAPEIAKELYEVQRKAEKIAEENGMRNRLAV